MSKIFTSIILVVFVFIQVGCTIATPDDLIQSPAPTIVSEPDYEDIFLNQGGGEPRSIGYWLVWNSCAPDNRSEIAETNGGRNAGWFILDDLLEDPGILLGDLQVETCAQGINLLQKWDLESVDKSGDAAYQLAAQLLAAQVNLAVGSEYCTVVDQVVTAGQLLLVSLGFDGHGSYLGPPLASQDVETAEMLVEQLGEYNSGHLCR